MQPVAPTRRLWVRVESARIFNAGYSGVAMHRFGALTSTGFAVLVAAAMVAGCGTEAGTDIGAGSGSAPPADAQAFSWPAGATITDTYCPTPNAGHLPTDAEADDAYICSTEDREVTGEGTWTFAVVRRVTGGLDGLLDSYATPDAPLTDGACTAELPDPRVVWLKMGGDVIGVRAPRDPCAKPTAPAIAAFSALTTEPLVEEKLQQASSSLADESGCSQEWKDMLSIEAGEGAAPSAVPPLPLTGEPLVACSYSSYSSPDSGELVAAKPLDASAIAAINAELAKSTADATCERAGHQLFVVMLTPDGGATYVSVDGCAAQQDGGWWRGTDALRALLG